MASAPMPALSANEYDLGAAAPVDNDDDDTMSNSSSDEGIPDSTTEESHSEMRIPIFIVDFYVESSCFLYCCLVSHHLPMEDNILVRFGSHDSKFVANMMPSASGDDAEATTDFAKSIENWIIPLCHSGHFKRVVWLRNSWCTQIHVGKYNLLLGEDDDLIKVDCPIDHFITEGKYCGSGEMLDTRSAELQVHNADTDELDPLHFLSSADGPHFVLAIDLDFFSTFNSLDGIYEKANCYAQLIEIFRYESNPLDPITTSVRRTEQLVALRSIFYQLGAKCEFAKLALPDPGHVPEETLTRIHNLAKALAEHYPPEEIDWMLMFDAGCVAHNGELPYQKSTPEQLTEYFGFFERFLQRLPALPAAITIAGTIDREGCPADQVDYIQKEVLSILHKNFGTLLHGVNLSAQQVL